MTNRVQSVENRDRTMALVDALTPEHRALVYEYGIACFQRALIKGGDVAANCAQERAERQAEALTRRIG